MAIKQTKKDLDEIFKLLFSVFLVLLFETSISYSEETRIKIGVLAPLSGENAPLGKQILNSIRMALIDINDNKIEIYPKDTGLDPNKTLQSARELKKIGVKIIIGPVFFKNMSFLHEIEYIIFI